jgi:predicted nucleic acid-binding protein
VIVLDASALVEAVAVGRPDPALLDRLERTGSLHAPHLLDVEFLHVLRRLVHRHLLGPDRAAEARSDFDRLGIVRYPLIGLSDRIWALRDNLSAYDASYVALAELLGCPLLTTDARIAKASGHRADVEVYGQP